MRKKMAYSCLNAKASGRPPKCRPHTRRSHDCRQNRKSPHVKAVHTASPYAFTCKVRIKSPLPTTPSPNPNLPENSVPMRSTIFPKMILPKLAPIPSVIIRYPASLLIYSFEALGSGKIRCVISDVQIPNPIPSMIRTINRIFILGKKLNTRSIISLRLSAGTAEAVSILPMCYVCNNDSVQPVFGASIGLRKNRQKATERPPRMVMITKQTIELKNPRPKVVINPAEILLRQNNPPNNPNIYPSRFSSFSLTHTR